MARRAIIDGHNALHRLRIDAGRHEADRRELLARVRALDPRAEVYFDARKAPAGLPETAREDGMIVHYCRRTEADRAILDRVLDAGRPADLLVVTDDLDLARKARQLGARTAGVGDWFSPREATGPSDKPSPGGLGPEDFDLPKYVNLRHPPEDLRDG